MADGTIDCPHCGCRLAQGSADDSEDPKWVAYLTGHDDGYDHGFHEGWDDGWDAGWADARGDR
jgi:hypothetical protein